MSEPIVVYESPNKFVYEIQRHEADGWKTTKPIMHKHQDALDLVQSYERRLPHDMWRIVMIPRGEVLGGKGQG